MRIRTSVWHDRAEAQRRLSPAISQFDETSNTTGTSGNIDPYDENSRSSRSEPQCDFDSIWEFLNDYREYYARENFPSIGCDVPRNLVIRVLSFSTFFCTFCAGAGFNWINCIFSNVQMHAGSLRFFREKINCKYF